MRASRLILGMLLSGAVCMALDMGCSAPSDPPIPPMDYGDAAELAEAEAKAQPTDAHAVCYGVTRGSICGRLMDSVGYHGDWVQYSITCDDPNVTTECMMYSLDPAVYDPQTWVYCCIP